MRFVSYVVALRKTLLGLAFLGLLKPVPLKAGWFEWFPLSKYSTRGINQGAQVGGVMPSRVSPSSMSVNGNTIQGNRFPHISRTAFFVGLPLLCCGALYYGYKLYYGFKKGTAPKKSSVKKRNFDLIEYTIEDGDGAEGTLYKVPKTIEDKEWKGLWALTRNNNVANQLEELIKNFKPQQLNTAFFRKAVRILKPAVQPFELTKKLIPFSDPKKAIKIHTERTYPVTRATLDMSPQKKAAYLRMSSQEKINFLTVLSAEYDGVREGERMFYRFHINIPPKTYEEQIENIYADLVALTHHMACAARIYCIMGGEEDPHRNCDYLRSQGEQAELVAFLVLRDGKYFRGVVREMAITFLNSSSQQLYYQAHRYYRHKSSQADEELFMKLLEVHPHDRSINLYAEAQGISVQEDAQRSPAHFKKIWKLLSIWAAYLVHEKGKTKNDAVSDIRFFCADLFKQLSFSYNIIDEQNLLHNILGEWVGKQST